MWQPVQKGRRGDFHLRAHCVLRLLHGGEKDDQPVILQQSGWSGEKACQFGRGEENGRGLVMKESRGTGDFRK